MREQVEWITLVMKEAGYVPSFFLMGYEHPETGDFVSMFEIALNSWDESWSETTLN